MPNNHTRNVNGLLAHAEAKRKAVGQKVDLAIKSLLKQHLPVNFNSVATLANVSKTTLYKSPEYRARIESLRQYSASAPAAVKHTVTDKGKDVILAAKNKRICELEAEIERLSSILRQYYAAEYEKY